MSFNSGQLYIGEPSTPIDRTDLLWNGGQFGFSETRGERGEANLELCIVPGESYSPEIGWPVWIYDPPIGVAGSQCRFVGTIEDRDAGYVGDAGLLFWSLSVLSLEQLYDTQPCPEVEYPDGTDAGTIAAALFATVSPPVSVTVGTIETGMALEKRTYDAKTNVWSAIKQLAVDSNLITYIDPRDQKFYFVSNGARTAPFTLLTQDLLQNGTSPLVHYKQSRSDFRNRQITQTSPATLPPVNAQFQCDGTTSVFTLPSLANQVLGAALTTSTAGTAQGTFTGVPDPGDTITVGDITYSWQSALDNTVPYEILIGGTANDCAVNLAAAINADISLAGIGFSFPTVLNPSASCNVSGLAQVTVRATVMGPGGNDVELSESATNFSWSAATITGGFGSLAIILTVGVEGTGTFDLYYTPGSATVRLAVTPGSGQVLTIAYAGDGLLSTGNAQAAALSIGGQYQVATPRNVTTAAGIVQQTAAILSAYSILPGQFEFQTFHPGCFPGDTLLVALTVPADLAARVNGYWLIQDVRGDWIEGFENLPDDSTDRHFRCTVKCINSVQFNNYQNTLQRLVDVGGTGSGLEPTQQPLTGAQEAQLVAYQPVIQIADTTVGNDIGPHISVATPLYSLSPMQYKVGQVSRLQGVLRQTLTADLTIRINCISFGSPSTTQSWELTFPSGWGPDDPIYVEVQGEINNGDVLYPDVVAGPATPVKDANGVAAVTLVWV